MWLKSKIDKGANIDEKELFDEWPERYDQWFMTPIGKLIREIEGELIIDLLAPEKGETIFDAGCGSGGFTVDYLAHGANVIGLDISGPMLTLANRKIGNRGFFPVRGDMEHLPFKDNYFDKVVSVTALEFIANAKGAVNELVRVTRPKGLVVVATLNSLSPWAVRRKAKMQRHILMNAYFRSPHELLALSPFNGIVKTAIHFQKDDDPARAMEIERLCRSQGLDTGAFVAARWQKPWLKCADDQRQR